MHRTHKRIIETIEGVAQHVGLALETEWSAHESELRGALSLQVRDASEREQLRQRFDEILQKTHDLGNKYGLTVSSYDASSDNQILLILQIDNDIYLDKVKFSGNINSYCREFADFFDYQVRKRRPKRKREDLGGDPNAEEHRFDVKLGGRISRRLRDRFIRALDNKGITQGRALTEAIEDYLEKLDISEPK